MDSNNSHTSSSLRRKHSSTSLWQQEGYSINLRPFHPLFLSPFLPPSPPFHPYLHEEERVVTDQNHLGYERYVWGWGGRLVGKGKVSSSNHYQQERGILGGRCGWWVGWWVWLVEAGSDGLKIVQTATYIAPRYIAYLYTGNCCSFFSW